MRGKLAEFVRDYEDEIKVFLLFFILYASLAQKDFGANEGSRIALTYSMVDYTQVQIDHYIDYTYKVDYAEYGGHFYSDKAPGSSILAIPIYLLIKALSIKDIAAQIFLVCTFTSGLLSALLCAMLYNLSGYFTQGKTNRIMVAASYGLGTIAFPYATMFYGHSIATFFGFASFYLLFLVKSRKVSPDILALSGALLGYSFVVEYPQAIIVFFTFLYLLTFERRISEILRFLLPAVTVMSIILFYNIACFGDPFILSYGKSGFFKDQFKQGLYSIKMPDMNVLNELLFKERRGLFVYSPILIFSVLGFFYSLKTKRRAESLFCMLVAISMLLFNASLVAWDGGWSYGPRYLISSLPYLSLLLVFSYNGRKTRYLAIPFLIASIIIMLAGVLTDVETGAEFPIRDDFEIILSHKYGTDLGDRCFYYSFMKSQKIPFILSASLIAFVMLVVLVLNPALKITKRRGQDRRRTNLR